MKKTVYLLLVVFFGFLSKAVAQPAFLGMTSTGGEGFGTFFKTDSSASNLQVISTFAPNISGASPEFTKLLKATNGLFYGVTSFGGNYNKGVLFEYNATNNNYQVKHHFNDIGGYRPYSSLVQASNGKLYGMTNQGGVHSYGVLFEYDILTSTYTKKFDFNSSYGTFPRAALIEASNGKMYGITDYGGANNAGVLFEYDFTNNTYTKKLDIPAIIGYHNKGSLLEASNGKMYGIAAYGGALSEGGIFEYDLLSNTITFKYSFIGNAGRFPLGSLIEASNGKMYGVTNSGGIYDKGVVFEYDFINNIYTKKQDFDYLNGASSFASLLQASNGNLYGMTSRGGMNNEGVLFEYNMLSDTLIKKIEFNSTTGILPLGDLLESGNGKLYGMTSKKGLGDEGTLFEFDYSNDSLSKKLDFNYSFYGANSGSLMMQASNGKVYGLMTEGGLYNKGLLFEYDPDSQLMTTKLHFDGLNGANPKSKMIQAVDGALYGITYNGGANDEGVLFRYDYATNTYTKKHDFTALSGKFPNGCLTDLGNGKIYGVTLEGAANNLGVIFEYNYASSTYTKKVDFDAQKGGRPKGALCKTPNGKLYGMTSSGASYNNGSLYEYDPITNVYTLKRSFNPNTGTSPTGELVLAANGNLFGLLYYGGLHSNGLLFEYNYLANQYSIRYQFNSIDGANPLGSLLAASNGKLYGMTKSGGLYAAGVLFEYDYLSNTYLKKQDFSLLIGGNPNAGKLLELNQVELGLVLANQPINVSIFPNPTTGSISLQLDKSYQTVEIGVHNLLGQLLSSHSFYNTAQINLDLKGDRGLYLIEIMTNTGQVATMKVVKD